MPTRNRRQFVSQSVWYFLRQDYPEKELIIIDDGEDSVQDLIPQDDRIRYVRLDSTMPLGAKRNLACGMSNGELIAHWDDDDWIAPNRLSLQVNLLSQTDGAVCGAQQLLYYLPKAGQAWLYQGDTAAQPVIAEPTLLYRKSAWSKQPFSEADTDNESFLRTLPSERIQNVSDLSFYVAIIHGDNHKPKNLNNPLWQRRPIDEVSRLLINDRDFYVSLRTGISSKQTIHTSQQAKKTAITLAGPVMVYDGYGSMTEYMALGMKRAGADVNIVPLGLDTEGISSEFKEVLNNSRPEPSDPVLYFCWPRADLDQFKGADNLFINTMWESSELPAGWKERLNRARVVIVPSKFVAQVCRDSGVTVPIEVVAQGIDPEVYHYKERPERDSITTLIVGTITGRKHIEEGIDAWKQAFRDYPDARLIIKSRFKDGFEPDDPRISFTSDNEPTRGIAHWYRQADVLLALGSEGFGLPLVEGMATGLPVIALNSEGQADICEEASDLLLPVDAVALEPADDTVHGPAGVRGVPSVTEVAEKLRWVAAHRDEAREMGKRASAWAIENRNIWDMGPAILDVMERYIQPPQPLRRGNTLWVPGSGPNSDVYRYAKEIASHTHAQVSPGAPDIQKMKLLHMHHHPRFINDSAMMHQIQEARKAEVPITVTQHAVDDRMHAWQREPDALVAMTVSGGNTLRKKWPGKRIRLIPHGCSNWFPPRKNTRGRVIGAFGPLEPRRGFWNLLNVLCDLPDAELLLFSPTTSVETEAQWEKDAAGLPVRRVSEALSDEEVATRLAEEADILVFWNAESAYHTVCRESLIGLASGVPVLASPTRWFSDVKIATHQSKDLCQGIEHLLNDAELQNNLVVRAKDYCRENSWSQAANLYQELWQELLTE